MKFLFCARYFFVKTKNSDLEADLVVGYVGVGRRNCEIFSAVTTWCAPREYFYQIFFLLLVSLEKCFALEIVVNHDAGSFGLSQSSFLFII